MCVFEQGRAMVGVSVCVRVYVEKKPWEEGRNGRGTIQLGHSGDAWKTRKIDKEDKPIC
jgi:hypothetical protein